MTLRADLYGECLTLNLLTWKIWWTSNNASRWQMGFNLACKELISFCSDLLFLVCLLEMESWKIHKTVIFLLLCGVKT